VGRYLSVLGVVAMVGCSDSPEPEPAPVAPAVARAPLVEPVPDAVTVVEFEPLPVLDPETGPVVAGRPWSDWQRLLEDPDSEIRSRALVDLERAGPAAKHAAGAIRKRLSDRDAIVRQNAVEAIAAIAPALAVAELIARLDDDEPNVRDAAVHALCNAKAAAELAVPALRKLLNAADAPRRHSILLALAGIGPLAKAAADDILRWATEPTNDRRDAYVALRAVAPAAKHVMDELIRRLADKDPGCVVGRPTPTISSDPGSSSPTCNTFR